MEGCFSESSVDHTVAWCLIRNGTFLKCSKGCGTWDGYLKSLVMPEVKSLLSCNSFESWAVTLSRVIYQGVQGIISAVLGNAPVT